MNMLTCEEDVFEVFECYISGKKNKNDVKVSDYCMCPLLYSGFNFLHGTKIILLLLTLRTTI